jgi:hypothetical protein
MNNTIKITLAFAALTIAGDIAHRGTTPPPTPTGYVVALTEEVEVEYLPDATVEVVHEEVEIVDLRAF